MNGGQCKTMGLGAGCTCPTKFIRGAMCEVVECPDGWQPVPQSAYDMETGRKRCYKSHLTSSKLSFESTRTKCKEMGGDLIAADSQAISDILYTIREAAHQDFWVGGTWIPGTPENPECTAANVDQHRGPAFWEWVDGTPFVYEDWQFDQPNGCLDEGIKIALKRNGLPQTWQDKGKTDSSVFGGVCSLDIVPAQTA